MLYLRYLKKIINSPMAAYNRFVGLLRGIWYILFYWFKKGDVKIRFPFYAYTKVNISGPGKVFIDKGLSTELNNCDSLTIKTLSKDAEVIIGKNCGLSGVTIRCKGRIVIGDNTIMAATLIQDVNIVSADSPIRNDTPSDSAIIIGNNVWIAANALVLANSKIGNNAVIGSNGLIYDYEVPAKTLAFANPVRRCIPITPLSKLTSRNTP